MDDESLQVRAPDGMVPRASSFGARRPPILLENEVHVWRAALDPQASQVLDLQRNLSEDERARVRRLHFQKDRHRFIVARGLLRVILAHYLDAQPAQLRFCYGAHGKPRLAMSDADGLHFSVSHSQGLALFAVTRGRLVGIDLEAIRPHPANEDVAEQFFTLREIALLRALPRAARQEAFFAFWTRKEAYAKARGEGLTIPLNRFDVSFPSGHPAILVGAAGHRQEASRWSLRDVNPGAGFAAALAVEGADRKLKMLGMVGIGCANQRESSRFLPPARLAWAQFGHTHGMAVDRTGDLPLRYESRPAPRGTQAVDSVAVHPGSKGILRPEGEYSIGTFPGFRVTVVAANTDLVEWTQKHRGTPDRFTIVFEIINYSDAPISAYLTRD